jgi:hypothetical protein
LFYNFCSKLYCSNNFCSITFVLLTFAITPSFPTTFVQTIFLPSTSVLPAFLPKTFVLTASFLTTFDRQSSDVSVLIPINDLSLSESWFFGIPVSSWEHHFFRQCKLRRGLVASLAPLRFSNDIRSNISVKCHWNCYRTRFLVCKYYSTFGSHWQGRESLLKGKAQNGWPPH